MVLLFGWQSGVAAERLVNLVRKGRQLVYSLFALQQAQVNWGVLVHPAIWQHLQHWADAGAGDRD